MTRVLGLALLLAIVPDGALAAPSGQAARDVGRGDPLRKILLDALRPELERDLGQKLIFVVQVLRTDRGWGFATVAPRTPAGAPIDFRRTRHAERQREGMLDGDTVHALLRRQKSKWTVVAFAVGPTDVPWAGWSEEFGAPAALFALPG